MHACRHACMHVRLSLCVCVCHAVMFCFDGDDEIFNFNCHCCAVRLATPLRSTPEPQTQTSNSKAQTPEQETLNSKSRLFQSPHQTSKEEEAEGTSDQDVEAAIDSNHDPYGQSHGISRLSCTAGAEEVAARRQTRSLDRGLLIQASRSSGF